MSLHAFLSHQANVKRPGHVIAGKKKATSESTISTGIECFLQPISDDATRTLLGQTASKAWKGFFLPSEDLLVGDKVVWTDRTPNLVFQVKGVTELPFPGDPFQDDHVEAELRRMDVE